MQRNFHFEARSALALALTVMSGCVIPIGPEFDDPEPNFPPYIAASSPAEGEIITVVSIDDPQLPEFSVTLGDPNVEDKLYVRWIFDYPKYDDNFSRLVAWDDNPLPASGTGSELRDPIRFAPSCFLHNIAGGISTHRLMLVVADRPFIQPERAEPDYRLDDVPDGAHRLRVTWTITNFECRR